MLFQKGVNQVTTPKNALHYVDGNSYLSSTVRMHNPLLAFPNFLLTGKGFYLCRAHSHLLTKMSHIIILIEALLRLIMNGCIVDDLLPYACK